MDAPLPTAAALQLEKITDKLYVVRGGGRTIQVGGGTLPNAGTSAAFITRNGVVLVDTKLRGWGQAIADKLKEVTDKPVTTIINTHAHMDHVSGNADFPASVQIIAHESTAMLMREMRPVTGGPPQPNIFAEQGGRGLPTRTFSDRMTIGSGSDRVELYFFGPAHTSGDTWVVFPDARAVHTGDAFAHKTVPVLDTNNGANGIEYPRTLARAVETLTNIDTVISGHYHTTLTMQDLRDYAVFTRDFVRTVQEAKRSGLTMDDFIAAWKLPDGYVDFSHLRPIRPDVEAIWNG